MEPVYIYKILQVLDITKFHPNIRIVRGLWYTGEISPELEKPLTQKDTVVHTTLLESYAMCTPFLNCRSLILRLT